MNNYIPTHANLTTAQAIAFFNSLKLFRRLRHHCWIRPLERSAPGRPSLYPLARLQAAQERMERGEFPPLLPCELKNMPVARRLA